MLPTSLLLKQFRSRAATAAARKKPRTAFWLDLSGGYIARSLAQAFRRFTPRRPRDRHTLLLVILELHVDVREAHQIPAAPAAEQIMRAVAALLRTLKNKINACDADNPARFRGVGNVLTLLPAHLNPPYPAAMERFENAALSPSLSDGKTRLCIPAIRRDIEGTSANLYGICPQNLL